MGGIASTSDEDTDGEFLDPNGFDLSYFKKSGTVNWHHLSKEKPEAIIGEPSKANITKKGMYVECDLYNDSKLARQVYELGKVMEKNSKTRRLGFSIEGKVIERDPLNKNRITKARITGLAITHQPKNANTFANIIKGEMGDDPIFDIEEAPSLEATGGKVKILAEVTVGDKVITIDSEGKVVYKALEANGSGAALKKESVEGSPKEISKAEVEEIKEFTKGEVYDRIFSDFPAIEIEKAQKLFTFISKISTMANKGKKTVNDKITDEDISKAYEFLKLTGDDEGEEVEKAEGEEEEEVEEKPKKTIEKAKKSEPAAEEEEEEEVEKADDEEEEEEEEKPAPKKKAAVKKEISMEKSNNDELLKGFENMLNKKLDERDTTNQKYFKAIGVVLKDLKNRNEELEKSLEDALNTPNERKSIDTKGRERFGEGEGRNKELMKGVKQELSLRKDRKKILDTLESATFEKGFDKDFGNSMTILEGQGTLPMNIRQRLLVEKGIYITE